MNEIQEDVKKLLARHGLVVGSSAEEIIADLESKGFEVAWTAAVEPL